MTETFCLRRLNRPPEDWLQPPGDTGGVASILEAVRCEGDAALRRLAASFGDPRPRPVPQTECRDALAALGGDVRESLAFARDAIRRYALAQRGALREFEIVAHGLRLGQTFSPIERVGVYCPGGRYPLASSVLMAALPARVAGVEHITVCTPNAAPDILAACALAEVDEVFLSGGAQAIAALAYGTESIEAVDKIVGPGNAFVTEAKRRVFGTCGIDGLAGPSELVAVASDGANAAIVASELLAQAEHDPHARVLSIVDDELLACAIDEALATQLVRLPATSPAARALGCGGCIVLEDLSAAVAIVDGLAPEHLVLIGEEAERLAGRVRHFGAVFVGPQAAVALGDYVNGPSHVLPTGRSARFSSGLSVLTFLNVRSSHRSAGALDFVAIEAAVCLAEREGLPAHAAAVRLRG